MENLHLLLTIVRFCSNLIEPYLTPIIDSIQKIMKTDERMINISL